MDKKTVGVLAILTASIMWAIEPILARYSYVNSDFLHTVALRSIFVTIIALAYALITNKGNIKIDRKEFSVLAYIAIAATVFGEVIYFYALGKSQILNVVLLGHMQPIFVVLMGYFMLKQDKLTKFDYIGMFFMMVAATLVTTKTFGNLLKLEFGTKIDLMVLGAAFLWATTVIAVRKYIVNLNAGVIVFYRYLISSILLLGYLALKSSLTMPNIYQIWIGIVISIGIILYYEGLTRIKGAQVSALELAAPFFASILGFVFFKETVTPLQAAGMLLMFIGVYYLAKREK